MDGSVGIVFDYRGKLLLVKRRDVPVWVFPGGGIEKNETPEKAVEREIFEESGYKVKITKKIAEYRYRGSGKNHVFKCKIISGSSKTSPESKEVAFFSPDNLPNPRHPVIDQWLKDLRLNRKTVIKKQIEPIKTREVLLQIFKYPIPVLRYFLFRLGFRINT